MSRRVSQLSVADAARIVVAVVMALLASGVAARGQEARPSPPPPFEGTSLPSPPQQDAPWSPSASGLPINFVTAAARLFEQGLADPRGCEYREVGIAIGSVWGGAGVFETRAWVLPAAAQGGRRFAIGWNGLVYPLVSVGARADLRADVLAVVRADEEARAKWAAERPEFRFYRHRNAMSEGGSLSHRGLLPMKAALLLRLGEGELARAVWGTWTTGMRADTNDDAVHLKDPYLMLASDWAWALFDRAVTAHMRGDDRLSLLSARALASIRPEVEAEFEARRIYASGGPYAVSDLHSRYLSFLTPLPLLLADQERREAERGKTAGTTPRARAARDVAAGASVEGLIDALDEVNARQWGQPGGVDLGEDPRVIALAAKGEAAVEPLLRVVETDARLTRSVGFGRDFFHGRQLFGVREAAYAALVKILKTSAFGDGEAGAPPPASEPDRWREVAERIRLYLKQYGGLSPEERSYRVLADDGATLQQWLQAAALVVQPASHGGYATDMVQSTADARRAGQAPLLRGESLRQKTGPTLSQLLVRRMDEAAARRDSVDWLRSLDPALSFATALAAWDGAAHLKELRRMSALLEGLHAGARGDEGGRRGMLMGGVVRLYLERCASSDASAPAEYARWLRTVRPEETGYSTVFLFEPAWKCEASPEIERSVAWMFNDPSSAWTPLLPWKSIGYVEPAKLVETPLLNFAGFREQLLKGLEDRRVAGTLTPDPASPNDKYDLRPDNPVAAAAAGAPNVARTTIKVAPDDPRAPSSLLTPVRFRACDVYAYLLQGVEGAPQIRLYWSEAERDAAVAACARLLRDSHGPLTYSPERAYKLRQ